MDYCLITGASGGLGEEFAYQLAESGKNLILTARRTEKLRSLAETLTQRFSIQCEIFSADLSEPNAAERLYRQTKECGFFVDTLINNAGFGELGDFLSADQKRQIDMMQVNMHALAELTYFYGQDMKTAGRGAILNVASAAAFAGGPHMAMYYGCKNFVLAFSEALSVELKPFGIKVTALCPGPTATDFEKNAHMGKSVMFSLLPPANAKKTVKSGLLALKKGKAVQYHGFVTKGFSLISRLVPRSLSRRLTAGMNRSL